MLSISSRTNSPACEETDLPWRLSLRARSMVRFNGIFALRRPLSFVRHPQRGHTEQTVSPGRQRRPAAAVRERLEGVDRVFVTVLGVDRFPGTEFDGNAAQPDLLPSGAGEVHFDAVVLERCKIEIGAELAIDAGEQVQVEFRSHAFGIVVGAIKNVGRLGEIDSDHEYRTGPEH